MAEVEPPDLTAEELRLLRHETFVAEVLKSRSLPHGGEQSKPRWQRFLETSGGTALITVLLGGFVGQVITWSIQTSLKDREFQEAWMKARGDQALVNYKEFMTQETEVMKSTYELIGNCISASEDLIILTSPEFAPETFTGATKQRTSLREKYNTIDGRWRSEREKIGLLMGYYHPNQPKVAAAWYNVQNSVSTYMDCAQRWYLEHLKPIQTGEACKKEQENLRNGLKEFNTNLEQARQYAWEGWDSPEKLKATLERE